MSDDDPAGPKREDPAVSMSAPARAGGAEADGAAGDGAPADEPGHRRPTGWIILCAVLAVAVVGLGIWALVAQSDADDSQAKLAATAAVAGNKASETPAPATTPTAT